MSFKSKLRTFVRSNYEDEEFDMDDIIIHNTKIKLKKEQMEYLLFEFSKKVSPTEYEHVFKAIKLVKIKRVPKKDLTLSSYLDMQQGVLTGYYQNQVNYIQIMANITKPHKYGLIFAYGVQGVSNVSMEEAMHEADIQMAAIERAITGTFRTMEYIPLTSAEAKWIFEKLGNMADMRIIRGVPGAKNSSARVQTNSFANSDVDVEEQTEEFLIGMDDYEYLFVLTATCVDPLTLSKWREAYLKEQTYFAGLQTGQRSMSFGLSIPLTFAANMGASQGWGSSNSENYGETYSTSHSVANGTSYTHSDGISHSVSSGVSHSRGVSSSYGISLSEGVGYNRGVNVGQNVGQSYGTSTSNSAGLSTSRSTGTSESVGFSNSMSQSLSKSESTSFSQSNSSSYGRSQSFGASNGFNFGTNYSHSDSSSSGGGSSWGLGAGAGNSTSQSGSATTGATFNLLPHVFGVSGSETLSSGIGTSNSINASMGGSSNWSSGVSDSSGASSGYSNSYSSSNGTSQSTSTGVSRGISSSIGSSQGYSTGISQNSGVSNSFGVSASRSFGTGTSTSNSTGSSIGASEGVSTSRTAGQSWSNGTSESWGETRSVSNGTTSSDSYGRTATESNGTSEGYTTSRGTGTSTNTGTSTGISGSMGLGPSLSFGRTMAWEDREVTYLLDLLNYSTTRIMAATNNMGMWFTDIYIATESEEASAAATQVAQSSWHDYLVMTCPLQVYKPSQKEKEYLFKHMSVFSPSNKREGIPGEFESYKYTTCLLSSELNAYSHPPRVNVGGIQAAIDDPPVLTLPADRQNGDIFLGYVANTEAYNPKRGYRSDFKYTLREDELHHAYISGASRSGKTVAARRLVAETFNNVRRGEKKKRMRFLIMDPKQDWRALANIIPPGHFRFYSLSDPNFHMIHMNLMKIPKGVYTERYADKLREIFIRSYGLADRAFQILGQAINQVYKDAGCYDKDSRFNQPNQYGVYPATEKSKNVTMEDVCKQLEDDLLNAKARDKQEAIQRILDRMESFSEPLSSIYAVFCNRGDDGMGIDDLLGADDVVVLESY